MIPTTFKSDLARIRRRRTFVSWRDTRAFARELRDLLALLDTDRLDPRAGVECAEAFFRADAAILGRADDSSGEIGDLFRIDAREIFGRHAARVDDRDWLLKLIVKLLKSDDYGVRDSVLRAASSYLSEAELRTLADHFWSAGEKSRRAKSAAADDWTARARLRFVEQCAVELKDAALFERARRASWPTLTTASFIDIARQWLGAGQPAVALTWLERIDPAERFGASERDELLRSIFDQLDRRDDVEALLWRRFRAERTRLALNALLEVIGEQRRNEVIADAVIAIDATTTFSLIDALFLLDCDRTAEAGEYVVRLHATVNGNDWYGLLPIGDDLAAARQSLAATVIFRALLDSILTRGETRAYGHGAQHLRRLERLAEGVDRWGDLASHQEYVMSLRERHGLKRSFWSLHTGISRCDCRLDRRVR